MPQLIAYLNGSYLPLSQAKVSVLDRGFLFGEGVYEVVYHHAGKPIAMQDHELRLKRSLDELGIAQPIESLSDISQKLITDQGMDNAKIYWHITRGVDTTRQHIPEKNLKPTVLVIAWPEPDHAIAQGPETIKALLTPDIRWQRCDIKSTMLAPNCIAKIRAQQLGFQEAIFHRDQIVTEGTSTCLFIIKEGILQTHPQDHWILPSITRKQIIQIAREHQIPVIEKPFTIDQMLGADEVLIGSTTTIIATVTQIDDHLIGDGKSGTFAKQFFKWFFEQA